MSAHGENSALQQYEAVKREVDRRFPAGRFVAVESGRVVADAETHRQLVEQLRSQGLSPKDMLIVEAGVDYPDSAIIFDIARAHSIFGSGPALV